MRRGLTFLLLVALLVALLDDRAALRAQEVAEIRLWDVVTWTNPAGQAITYEGTIIAENDEAVTFRTRTGLQTPIKRGSITELKHRRSPQQAYAERAQNLSRVNSPEDRANLHLDLGLWCLRPLAELDGEPPMPDKAFDHLYKAVQIDPRRAAAYPHLLDLLAQEREAGGGDLDREVDIYMLAAAGGFKDQEIDFRLAEIYKEKLGLTDQAARILDRLLKESAAAGGVEGEARVNRAMINRARRQLASIYRERGEVEKVSPLFASADGAPSFEALWETARWHMSRGAPEDRKKARELFEEARKLQPDLPELARELAALDAAEGKARTAEARLLRLVQEGSADPGLRVDLALAQLQQGKFKDALAAVAPAIQEGVPAAERARGHLVRGLAADYRGDGPGALAEYRSAFTADPSCFTAALLLSGAQLRSGDAAGARSVLTGLIRGHAARRGLFAAYARAMADVEIGEGQPRKALSLLEYAAEIDPRDPLLRRKIGVLLLGQGELDRAFGHLDAAEKLIQPGRDPALMNAMACYHYRRGDFAKARDLFGKVKALVPRPQAKAAGGPAPPVPPERLYAEMGLQYADDAQRLEVWLDDFDRAPSGEVTRNWREVESYGVAVSIQDGKLLFQGQQANEAGGVTLVQREEPAEYVERLSVRLRFDASSGPVRAGIRIETSDARGGPPGAGLVFFRDHDGTMRYARKTSRTGWEDAQPTLDQDPQKGKPVFSGNVKWPADGGFHSMTIRKAVAGLSSGASSGAFDLLLDGAPVAQNVVVEGLRGKSYLVGVSGQVEALGTAYRFEAEDFRLYRERSVAERSRQR